MDAIKRNYGGACNHGNTMKIRTKKLNRKENINQVIISGTQTKI